MMVFCPFKSGCCGWRRRKLCCRPGVSGLCSSVDDSSSEWVKLCLLKEQSGKRICVLESPLKFKFQRAVNLAKSLPVQHPLQESGELLPLPSCLLSTAANRLRDRDYVNSGECRWVQYSRDGILLRYSVIGLPPCRNQSRWPSPPHKWHNARAKCCDGSDLKRI